MQNPYSSSLTPVLFGLCYDLDRPVAAGVNAEPLVQYEGGIVFDNKVWNMMVRPLWISLFELMATVFLFWYAACFLIMKIFILIIRLSCFASTGQSCRFNCRMGNWWRVWSEVLDCKFTEFSIADHKALHRGNIHSFYTISSFSLGP